MRLQLILNKKQKKDFINFVYEVYKNNPSYRDNFNFSAKNFLYQRDTFAKNCTIKPVLVYDQKKIVARCMYIHNKKLPALQIGFFEALKDQEIAVDMILAEAKKIAQEMGLPKIIIGLNGHLTYGVGFLTDNFDVPNSYDGIYTQDYYIDYFRKYALKEYGLTTYYMLVDKFNYEQKLLKRIYKNFSFRTINLKDFKKEMKILGDLFNKTLGDTQFYFHKEIIESYELLKELLPLIKNENIIYVMKDGQEIGFIFWHPNYHELFKSNKKSSTIKFIINHALNKNKIKEMKTNAIGILPEYQGSSAIFGLFYEVYKVTKGRYIGGESSFVWDNNAKSTLLCRRVSEKDYKHYVVFVLDL